MLLPLLSIQTIILMSTRTLLKKLWIGSIQLIFYLLNATFSSSFISFTLSEATHLFLFDSGLLSSLLNL